MTSHRWLPLALGLTLGCGGAQMKTEPPPACSAATCGGCCNGNRCESGTSSAACGSGGVACTTCTGTLSCVASSCQVPMMPMMTVDSGTPGPKRVFITRNGYPGDLRTAGNGTDGLNGADRLCQLAADSVVLGGTWKAFLSSSTVSAIDRIADVGPWFNLQGQRVFHNKAGFLTGPLTAIEYTERGEPTTSTGSFPRGATVWTGSTATGRPASWTNFSGGTESAQCEDWTFTGMNSIGAEYHTGNTGTGNALSPEWMAESSNAAEPCFAQLSLYCFEQ